MAIKWNITTKAMKARGIMDQISAEYDGFIEGGNEHLTDIKGLRAQVGEMQDDLQAAANIMGNGSGASGEVKDSSEALPAATKPDLARLAVAPSNGQQTIVGDQRQFDRMG